MVSQTKRLKVNDGMSYLELKRGMPFVITCLINGTCRPSIPNELCFTTGKREEDIEADMLALQYHDRVMSALAALDARSHHVLERIVFTMIWHNVGNVYQFHEAN